MGLVHSCPCCLALGAVGNNCREFVDTRCPEMRTEQFAEMGFDQAV